MDRSATSDEGELLRVQVNLLAFGPNAYPRDQR
jgi:hypothetical protein